MMDEGEKSENIEKKHGLKHGFKENKKSIDNND